MTRIEEERIVYRHAKRGTDYELIGIGKMQAQGWYRHNYISGQGEEALPVDMREVAVYRSLTDPTEIWVRPREEFEDGRFIRVDTPPELKELRAQGGATVGRLDLDEDDLETILAVGRNEQSGRITNYELKELVRVYRLVSALETEAVEQPVTGWRPIATAPKDGSYFLGLAKKGKWVSQCKYVGPDERYPNTPLNWFMGVDGWPQPTHWMPLPTPPALSSESKP